MVRPWVVALVGPTGAGKTTTIAKLATNPLAFGNCRVGLIGLDTYRVGAVEQLETYADLADLPVEIAYSEAEVTRAVARLHDCEIVLVDTPGRGPRNTADTEAIHAWLALLAPDEVHLTLPAAQLPAVTRRMVRAYDHFGVTHLLATKLDEYPAETAIFTIAQEHARRMRWVTDGQEVPGDLRAAAEEMARALASRDGALLLESVA
jgi:flagellar biosynthesis protein FlhF